MKSKTFFIGICFFTIILSGCGQTGPLYLPKTPSNQQATVTQNTTSPHVANPRPVVQNRMTAQSQGTINTGVTH